MLAHLGVLPGAGATPVEKPSSLYVLTARAHVIVEDDGVFEPLHRLGAEVRAGELAGRIHFITQPGRRPVDLHYRADGIVYGRRQPGRVRPGNCCLVVATPYESRTA